MTSLRNARPPATKILSPTQPRRALATHGCGLCFCANAEFAIVCVSSELFSFRDSRGPCARPACRATTLVASKSTSRWPSALRPSAMHHSSALVRSARAASTSTLDSLFARPPTPDGLTTYEWAEAQRREAAMVVERNEKRATYESDLSRRGTGDTRQSFNSYQRKAGRAHCMLAKMDERDSLKQSCLARNEKRASDQAQQSGSLPKLVSIRRSCEDGEVVPLPDRQAVFLSAEGLVDKVERLFAQQRKRLSWREVQSALQPTLGLVPEGAARRAITAARKRQRTL